MNEKDVLFLKEVWGTLHENRYNLLEDGDEFDPDDMMKELSYLIKRMENEVKDDK